jgi:hypothetical protein
MCLGAPSFNARSVREKDVATVGKAEEGFGIPAFEAT